MEIKPLRELSKAAFTELKELQSGKKRLVKTGYDFIDTHIGGLLNGDITIISGLSSHGKSETLFRMRENILNKEINPDADDFVFLDISLEMKIFNVILRGIHRKLEKSKKNILFEEFTEEEKQLVNDYYKSLQDDRQFVNQSPTTPEEFYNSAREFLLEHKDKKAVIISIDHILLLSGGDKKGVLDVTMELINKLKLEFENSYYIVLSQMNRSLVGRAAEKDINSTPNSADLYGSEFMQQTASYSIIIFNPFKLGINEYSKVNAKQYDYLEEHFGEIDKKGKVSFPTLGKLFFNVIKVREGDAVYKDLFIEDMNVPNLEKYKAEDNNIMGEMFEPNFDTSDPF